MNVTSVFCCYVLLPYFASIVSPPQEAITCTACLFTNKKPQPCGEAIKPEWFTQKFDHFHRSDKRTWQQKYYVNPTHYEVLGPVFFLIGGQDKLTPELIQEGRWTDYAQRSKALLIALEHRFFGESLPSGNLEQKHFGYLNSEQVLADAARFIHNFRRENKYLVPETAKWIAIGVSEAGSLAAWLRMKYPHLVHGVLSLSAPLLAKAKFDEFYEHIQSVVLKEENNLPLRLKLDASYTAIHKLFDAKTFTIGWKFNMCVLSSIHDGDTTKNVEMLYFTFANMLSKVLLHGDDTLKLVKEIVVYEMTSDNYNKYYKPIHRFAMAVDKMLDYFRQDCLPGNYMYTLKQNTKAVNSIVNTNYVFPLELLGKRQVVYQNCAEFGQFQTAENSETFFGSKIPLQFYVDICTALFGNKFNLEFLNKAVLRTNLIYGGLDNKVSNAIFVYGDLDPWKKLGITSPKTEDNNVAFIIQGAMHCDNLDGVGEVEVEIYKKLVDLLKLP